MAPPGKAASQPAHVSDNSFLNRKKEEDDNFVTEEKRKSSLLQTSSLSPPPLKSPISPKGSSGLESSGEFSLHSTIPSSNTREYLGIKKESASVLSPSSDDSRLTNKVLQENEMNSSQENQGENLQELRVDLTLTPFQVESKLQSYGPYIRIYDQSTAHDTGSAFSLKSSSMLATPEAVRFHLHTMSAKQSLAKQHQQVQRTSLQHYDTNPASPISTSPSNVVIDVSPLKTPLRRKKEQSSQSGSLMYPSSITIPPGMKTVVVGKNPDTVHKSHHNRSMSNVLTLSRPTSNHKSSKYGGRSSHSSGINQSGLVSGSSFQGNLPGIVDPSVHQLPLLEITNALRLYLKMKVFLDDDNTVGGEDKEEEKILAWATGSFVLQGAPFIKGVADNSLSPGLVSFLSLFNSSSKQKKEKEGLDDSYLFEQKTSPLFQPGYLLITNKFIYVSKPLFQLTSLSNASTSSSRPSPFHFHFDEQTMYIDPTRYFNILQKIAIQGPNSIRVDVGPGQQYLGFHTNHQKSLVFCTRSRRETMKIIEALTTSLDIHSSVSATTSIPTTTNSTAARTNMTMNSETAANPSRFKIQLNQNVEWAITYLQKHILIQPNKKGRNEPKFARILSYYSVWPSQFGPLQMELEPYEVDGGVKEQVSPVDFAFIQFYIQSVFLRYFKPVAGIEKRGVEILTVAVVSSREYLYVVQEALDVWPPPVFPPETISTHIQSTTDNERSGIDGMAEGEEKDEKKGFVADRIPPFTLLGVGRIREVSRMERWRSWKLNQCHPETPSFHHLGSALQNGVLGYLLLGELNDYNHHGQTNPEKLAKSFPKQQQGSSSGFLWWCRIYFGYRENGSGEERPALPPTAKPVMGYWWDVCFRCRESCDEFMQGIIQNELVDASKLELVYGDD